MPPEPFHIPDFRFLAKAVPEYRDRGANYVSCSIGYSLHHRSLIRWSHFDPRDSLVVPRWTALQGRWQRGTDSRGETLYPVEVDSLADLQVVTKPNGKPDRLTAAQGYAEIEQFLRKGTDELRAFRHSIGVVRPGNVRPYWTTAGQEELGFGIKSEPLRLRVKFITEDQKPHDMTILDWQYYQGASNFRLKKYADPHQEVIRNLLDPQYRHLFVLGNLAQHPANYVVVGVVSMKVKEQPA